MAGESGSFAQGAGTSLQATGLLMGAIGSYYSALSQKDALKSQAETARFYGRMSDFNARIAMRSVRDIYNAGRNQIARMTLAAGQARAGTRASMAARNVQGGYGNTAEVLASMDYVRQEDTLMIDANVERQASQTRMQGTNLQIQGMMSRAQAANLQAQAKGINPWMAATTSLIGGGGQMLSQYARDQRQDAYYARMGGGA